MLEIFAGLILVVLCGVCAQLHNIYDALVELRKAIQRTDAQP